MLNVLIVLLDKKCLKPLKPSSYTATESKCHIKLLLNIYRTLSYTSPAYPYPLQN